MGEAEVEAEVVEEAEGEVGGVELGVAVGVKEEEVHVAAGEAGGDERVGEGNAPVFLRPEDVDQDF